MLDDALISLSALEIPDIIKSSQADGQIFKMARSISNLPSTTSVNKLD